MLAPRSLEQTLIAKRSKCVMGDISDEKDIAAVSAVPSHRSATWHKLLTPERYCAPASLATDYLDICLIEHCGHTEH